jgi:GAF domain-containing protein
MLRLAAQDDEHLEILRGLGFRSSMIVPLRAGGRVLGDLAMVSAESGRRFGPADLMVAQELADRCALFLEQARLYDRLREAEGAARRSRDDLEAILSGVADVVTAQGPDGRLHYANDAAVRTLGFDSAEALLSAPLAEIVGRFVMFDEDRRPMAIERLPGRRALLGEDEPEPVTVR